MRRILVLALLMAAPAWGQSSRDFDGSDDQILCGDIEALEGINNLTVGLWTLLDDDDGATGGPVAKYQGGATSNRAWQINKTGAELIQWLVRTDAPALGTATSSVALSFGVWTCIVGTYNNADATASVRLYINGVADGTANPGDGTITNSVQEVTVGQQASNFWDGKVAHLFAEPRTWRPDEIASFCRGDLRLAQLAASRGGGYLPLWDPEADPAPYRGFGVFGGACAATAEPGASSLGPPVFIPGGGR